MTGDDEYFGTTDENEELSEDLSDDSYIEGEYYDFDDEKTVIDPEARKKTKLTFYSDKTDYGQNRIIELDRYWPHGMKTAEPVNPNFLYVGCVSIGSNLACKNCPNKEYYELSQRIGYGSYCEPKTEVELDEHPKAYHKYLNANDKKDKKEKKIFTDTNVYLVLRPSCCGRDSGISYNSDTTNFFAPSKCIRFYYQKYVIYAYLMVDPESIPLIPKHLDFRFSKVLERIYLKGYFQDDKVSELSDTFDFPEAVIPAGFKLTLRDYQLRSISWMMSLEAIESLENNTILHAVTLKDEETFIKIKLGHSPYYVEFAGYREVTESPETVKSEPLRLWGGILADDTGSGKTVTTLGLIHASPFTKDHEIQRSLRFKNVLGHIPSRASCIICPSNIQKQWMQEALKCNPKFKLVGLSSIYDHQKISLKDIIEADVVIMSYQFILNANYQSAINVCDHPAIELRDYKTLKGRVNIRYIHFYRLILDEFHELNAAKVIVQNFVKSISSDYIWGLTGTPKASLLSAVLPYFQPSNRLLTVVNNNKNAEQEFESKFIKRNVPDLKLPPLINETVWVDLSPSERFLFDIKSVNPNTRQKIMMCSHYQLSDTAVSSREFLTLNEAENKMSRGLEAQVITSEADVNFEKEKLEKLQNDPDSTASQIKACKTLLETFTNNHKTALIKFNFLQNVFKMIRQPDSTECLICYDTIPDNSLAILPCSHVYCYECVQVTVQRNKYCPLCHEACRNIADIYRIRVNKSSAKVLPGKLKEVDTSKYGSKLIALYSYIFNLIETDSNARIILFLQYSDLADFISETLKELELKHVRVAGNVFQRHNAIKKFRESKDVRLIMLSSENSVSGINLTQTTHVILLHPFWSDKNEEIDLAYEKQGISRAYRFGLKHPLKVVRFACRDTVEEEITLRRENMKL